MNVIETIKTRRSIRKFKPDPIPKTRIIELLEAANLAPTAGNKQPWEFLVVARRELDKLAEKLDNTFKLRLEEVGEDVFEEKLKELPIQEFNGSKVKGLRNFYKSLGGAPVAIIAYTKKEIDPWKWSCNVQDVSAAIENLILAAWFHGIGTCWMTGPLHKGAEALKAYFRLPEDREILAIIPLGYPAEKPTMPPKKDVLAKVKWIGFD